MPSIGLPEFVFSSVVGLLVGLGLGIIRQFDSKRMIAMLVTLGFWCAFVGGIGLTAIVHFFDSGSVSENNHLTSLMFFASGFALVFGTPVAFALWWMISTFRFRNVTKE